MSKEKVTYNRRLGKWEAQQKKAGEKMEQTEVLNVKKDDTGRQDPLGVGKFLLKSQAMPQGQAFSTMIPPPRQPWWNTRMGQWPPFTKLSPEEHNALFPPCWVACEREWGGWASVHEPGHWKDCDLCRVEFTRSQGSIPSEWICRCGNDLLWCHRESPPIYETCRPCFDAMRAAGIDNEMWKARVRREGDQLISEQAVAAETAKTGQS